MYIKEKLVQHIQGKNYRKLIKVAWTCKKRLLEKPMRRVACMVLAL